MFRVCIISVLLLFFCSCNQHKTISQTIMINNKIESNEWSDAKKETITPAYDLLYKHDENYYYLAIKGNEVKPYSFYVDLYLSTNEKLENIHASHQIGYRNLTGIDWTDEWSDTKSALIWGYNHGWVANTVSTNRAKYAQLQKDKIEGNLRMKAINPYDGYEFQFSKKYWKLDKSAIRIQIRDLYDNEIPQIYFPENSNKTNAEYWLKLNWL